MKNSSPGGLRRRSLATLALLGFCTVAGAQATWPKGPITLVVPFPPGGSVDVVARALSKQLGDAFGQPVVVDNRAGASGNIAATFVARARPDGQTLFVTSSGVLSANQFLYKKTGFDAQKDLAPVIRVAMQPNILLVNPSLPVHNLAQLIAYAKAKPGALNVGSAGVGTGQDIATRQLVAATGIDVLQVQYKGGAPVIQDLLANQVQAAFDTSPTALPYAREKDGKLRAIAISSARRSPLLPQLPTVAESGVPGFDSVTWIGVAAPAHTPPEVVRRINREIDKALQGALGKHFAEISLEPIGGTPEAMAESIRKDAATYGAILKAAGVEPQ